MNRLRLIVLSGLRSPRLIDRMNSSARSSAAWGLTTAFAPYIMAMIINAAMILTMAVVNPMPGHYPNPPVDNEAHLGRIVASLFREEGWKVVEEPREKNVAPDFLVSGHGKKFVVELKRASEGRKDRVIPLLSQAALEAV